MFDFNKKAKEKIREELRRKQLDKRLAGGDGVAESEVEFEDVLVDHEVKD